MIFLGFVADLPPENETTGYILIHAEGGLNQQRIAVCLCCIVLMIISLLTSILAYMIIALILPVLAGFLYICLKYWNFNKGHHDLYYQINVKIYHL